MPKNFIGEPFCDVFQTISGIEEFHGEEGGREPRFPVEYFLSNSAKKFLKGTLICFTEFPLSKNVRDKGGCDSRFSVENLFVSQCRRNSQGNPSAMCFRKILVAK